MNLNKTETKFVCDLLVKRIAESNRVLDHSLKNYLNPEMPNYDEQAYEKQKKKHMGFINRSNTILSKLN